MTTKLALYNGALLRLGQRKIASLSEDREPRRRLDDAWDDGFIDYVLGQGQWKFAKRTVRVSYNASEEPDFGFRRVFDKEEDFIRTIALCSDEYFKNPLLEYESDGSYFYADVDEIYLSFVSNGSTYGGDLSLWPAEVTEYAKTRLAYLTCEALTQGTTKLDKLEKRMMMELIDARSKCAMESPTRFPPAGSWSSSRRGGHTRTRGLNGNLMN